ncbi:MAG: hypothetical protein NZ520_06430 [bacterium]|nr:hypothetical protein [bacterium]MDW8105825.1 hypothetical protein [Armatimonadota bacterium]
MPALLGKPCAGMHRPFLLFPTVVCYTILADVMMSSRTARMQGGIPPRVATDA